MSRSDAVKKVLSKLQPKDVVRSPKVVPEATGLPKDYFQKLDEGLVANVPDTPDSVRQAALRMKQEFPPVKGRDLPEGGKMQAEIDKNRAYLGKLKSGAGSAFNAPGTLKNKALTAIAQKLRGQATNAPDDELAFEAVDAVAEKLGIPASSWAGQIGKAALATAIETLAPQNLMDVLPVGKILSKGGKVVKADGVLGKGKRIASESADALKRKMNANTIINVLQKIRTPSLAEQLEKQGAKRVVPKGKIVPSKD